MPTNNSWYVLPCLLSSGFTLNFWFYDYHYIITAYILPYYSVLFHHSPALIILYHACSLLDITYYLSACSYMCVLMTRFLMHALGLGFIDTRVFILACHLAFATPLVGEF